MPANSIPIVAYILCSDATLAKKLKEQVSTISALVKGSKVVEVVERASDVPEGCSSDTVGADIVVHLMIKGFINIETELAKAEKKIAAAQAGLAKHQAVVSRPETPAEIRAISEENVSKMIGGLWPFMRNTRERTQGKLTIDLVRSCRSRTSRRRWRRCDST